MLWSEGVSKLTKLTGDERVGKMFAIVLVALTVEGEAFFTKSLKGGSKTWKRMVYCFQQVLCYWAWLKQDHYWMADNEEAYLAATESIKTMMRQLQNLWPRKEGLEWLLTIYMSSFMYREISIVMVNIPMSTVAHRSTIIFQSKMLPKKPNCRNTRLTCKLENELLTDLFLHNYVGHCLFHIYMK